MGDNSIDDFYSRGYEKILDSGMTGIVMSRVHRSLEIPYRPEAFFKNVLEIGAGKGQHLSFVAHGYHTYLETDLRIENLPRRNPRDYPGLIQKRINAESLESLENESFDRLIATCLLAHLPEPREALENWKRVLRPGGVASIYLPADPGMMLRLARNLTTKRKAQKLGFNYDQIHNNEHRFHFPYLEMLVKDAFGPENTRVRAFPVPRLGWNFALWFVAYVSKK